jgi:hypothetical protein
VQLQQKHPTQAGATTMLSDPTLMMKLELSVGHTLQEVFLVCPLIRQNWIDNGKRL